MKAAHEIAALPAEAVAASRRLMRGSPDETSARIDEEVRLFKERLQSAEAQAAFERVPEAQALTASATRTSLMQEAVDFAPHILDRALDRL